MLEIYKTISSIYKEKFQKVSTNEFKAGFGMAMELLRVGLIKQPKFNLALKLYETERALTKLKTTNEAQRKELKVLLSKLNTQALIVPKPLDIFKIYDLQVNDKETINIIINADKETVMMLWFYFLRKTVYVTAEECKAKFIVFINGYTSKGFIIYKDIKTYNKENDNDSKKR